MSRRKLWSSFCLAVCCGMLLLAGPVSPARAAGEAMAKELIENTCSSCHKFEGKPESKFNLQAPDLMWGGVKYQRDWLVRWLEGKEENLYPNGYRWDKNRTPAQHMTLSKKQAVAVADYMEKHYRDPRVKENALDLSDFSPIEAQFGAEIYKQYSCLGCHQIKDDEGNKFGGPISVTLYTAGQRYDVDWLYRFALNPQDFTPHSGEYLADITGRKVRHLVGYLMTLGNPDFKFYEPWNSKHFKNASVENGKELYGVYCAQCHGPSGKGDGVGAAGLDPKPAVHADLPLSDYPEDYLYNVVYYGGKSVGKSPNMPDWGLTLSDQQIADVIAFLRFKFKGAEQAAAVTPKAAGGPLGVCPQDRKTKKAPQQFLNMKNPLAPSEANVGAGEKLYMKTAKPIACAQCHGKQGDGNGALGSALKPPPRNFTCGSQMNELPDGQLFWIIKNGSPGTGMMAFQSLDDDEIWKVVHYIRSLAR